MLENRRELMEKNIAKLSVAVICSLCFSIVGFAHAGSSAKVTDEDKKAVEEVSETQESTADQGNNESKASEEEKNKEEEGKNAETDKAEDSKQEEKADNKESSEEKSEIAKDSEEQKKSMEVQEENNKSDGEEAKKTSNEAKKAEVIEEMTEGPLPEPKNGDWYSQELSEESKKILEDFDILVADIIEHAKEAAEDESQVQYRREKANEFFTNHFGEVEEVASVEDITVKSNDNTGYDIPVRVYKVADQPSKHLLMYVHGGGWTQGNIDTYGYLCRKLAKSLNMDVASVDYRLAPENQYPMPLDDVLSVYKHYVRESGYKNIVIAGDGAGGNLCAALCIKINEEGLRQPSAQILMYPPLGNNFESKSYETFGKSMALSKESTMGFFRNYTGRENSDTEMSSNKFIYPLLEDDMKVFPRTMIISAGYDVLLDDQLQFAEKLRQNDRFVWHIVDEGAVHGFMTYGNPYDSLVTENCQKIKKFLGNTVEKAEYAKQKDEKEENKEESSNNEKKKNL